MGLSGNLADALSALGGGFLKHPGSDALAREAESDPGAFYMQLQKLVLRLLFVFAAEDKGMLGPGASMGKELRRRAASPGQAGPPAFEAFNRYLGSLAMGSKELGLEGLGSSHVLPGEYHALASSGIGDEAFLQAIGFLGLDGGEPADFAASGLMELGVAQEAMSAFHPAASGGSFELSGNLKRAHHAYYSSPDLVDCLLESALDPALQALSGQEDPIMGLETVTICDPACGSGTFLIMAARRLLAKMEKAAGPLSPEERRAKTRRILGRNLYGVDISPMAVDACRMRLWLESGSAPLVYLDHHIRQGNAIIGSFPGPWPIPDEAFRAMHGDEREACQALRDRNRRERDAAARPSLLSPKEPGDGPSVLLMATGAMMAMMDMPEEEPGQSFAKAARHMEIENSMELSAERLKADSWCFAFLGERVFPEGSAEPSGVTLRDLK